ncbi:winged helix-turn-helix domain-containing protein [Streptomyces sp. NPDC091217]|uniref:helix-turn-helix domain-containing protein n=1 Tax=Streptomyces sp. NPDC091217 TaxID=3365975 RepID=UPI00380DF9EF
MGRKFHVSCSVSGATGLIHRLGFSPQVPTRPHPDRDGERPVLGTRPLSHSAAQYRPCGAQSQTGGLPSLSVGMFWKAAPWMGRSGRRRRV